jgi:hypothetical protein
MRKFVSILVMALAAAPVFANATGLNNVPEPEVMSLLGIGALAFFAARRLKK